MIPFVQPTKELLRSQMRKIRAALNVDKRVALSLKAGRKLAKTPVLQDFLHPAPGSMEEQKYLTVFSAFGSEISISSFVASYPQLNYALPIVTGPHTMEFVAVSAQTMLQPKSEQPAYLVEPAKRLELPEDAVIVEPAQIVAMIIPGLAFDTTGRRIGYGKGYYDIYIDNLPNKNTPLVGVCFDEQIVEAVPTEENDQLVDYVVTPTRIIKCA